MIYIQSQYREILSNVFLKSRCIMFVSTHLFYRAHDQCWFDSTFFEWTLVHSQGCLLPFHCFHNPLSYNLFYNTNSIVSYMDSRKTLVERITMQIHGWGLHYFIFCFTVSSLAWSSVSRSFSKGSFSSLSFPFFFLPFLHIAWRACCVPGAKEDVESGI